MLLDRLWLTDFRSYASAEVAFAPGLTAIIGDNGQGKTNLLEAVGYLATLSSFRGAPNEALVRRGAPLAVVRAEGRREDRQLLIEAEITPTGRGRVQVNRQRLARTRDLLGALRVSVFAPDDLELVKGGPAARRRYLDDALGGDPAAARRAARRARAGAAPAQRPAAPVGGPPHRGDRAHPGGLGRQAGRGGRGASPRPVPTLVERLGPVLAVAYDQVAGRPAEVGAAYVAPWREEGLAEALARARRDELRRGVTLVGPHRDELELTIAGLPARTHASQGEQRSLALALRLAAHRVVTEETGSPPILLLDDVFSELDPERSAALVAHLPPGQTLLTSAAGLPPGARPELVLHVEEGRVS